MAVALNFAFFQIAWLACVLGAAQGMPWIGPLVVALVAGYHLARATSPRGEARLLVAAAGIGLVFDSLLVATGWLAYPSGQWHAALAPYWIVAMWIAFATTLNVSLRWLHGRWLIAGLFGAFGGPLAYLGGAKLGGVAFVETLPALVALAVGWAVFTPLLVTLATRFGAVKDGLRGPSLAAATE